MLAALVEIRLEDVRHGHRFAPMPRDPPPVVKCGHDLSTPHRRPPPPGRVRCARPGGRRALRLRRLERGRRSRRRRRDRRPRRPGVPRLDRRLRRRQHRREVRRLEAPAGRSARASRAGRSSWRSSTRPRTRPPTAGRRSRRCAPGWAPRLRSAFSTSRPTAPTRQCSGSPRSRDKSSLEGALTKEKDVKAAGTHGGFDVFTDSKGSASAIAISDDTALVSNSQAAVTAAIDRLAASSDRLSDSADYKDTLATLPSDNIVVGYAPGSTLPEARRVLAATRTRSRARCGAAGAARPDLVEARRHPHPRLRDQRDRRGPPHPRDDAAQRQGDRPARAVHARPARPRARQLVVRSDVRQPRRDHQAGGRSGARHQRRTRRSRSPRSRPCSASSWTTSTRCSPATRPSTPGLALRSRRA